MIDVSSTLLLRPGTTAQHSSFTGGVAEVTVDTDKKTVVVHDGATAGGSPLATAAGPNDNMSRLGVNTTSDATNKLAVRSNAALLTALYAAEGGNGDMQVKVNREATADTGSFLFQKAFSGRAEIGNIASDDFSFKVSPDGSTFYESIKIVGSSGLVELPIGKLKFPATQNPSSDVNTLDDYEEGTWTPDLLFGGGSTGLTYASRSGTYTKIGNRLWGSLALVLSAKGTSTGAVTIGGLPYTQAFGTQGSASCAYYTGMASVGVGIFGRIFGTTITLTGFGSTAAAAATDANFANSSELHMTFNGWV